MNSQMRKGMKGIILDLEKMIMKALKI